MTTLTAVAAASLPDATEGEQARSDESMLSDVAMALGISTSTVQACVEAIQRRAHEMSALTDELSHLRREGAERAVSTGRLKPPRHRATAEAATQTIPCERGDLRKAQQTIESLRLKLHDVTQQREAIETMSRRTLSAQQGTIQTLQKKLRSALSSSTRPQPPQKPCREVDRVQEGCRVYVRGLADQAIPGVVESDAGEWVSVVLDSVPQTLSLPAEQSYATPRGVGVHVHKDDVVVEDRCCEACGMMFRRLTAQCSGEPTALKTDKTSLVEGSDTNKYLELCIRYSEKLEEKEKEIEELKREVAAKEDRVRNLQASAKHAEAVALPASVRWGSRHSPPADRVFQTIKHRIDSWK